MNQPQNIRSLRSNSKKGFTLIELIVVIVILAILAAAITPAILGYVGRANQQAADAEGRTLMLAATSAAMLDAAGPMDDGAAAGPDGITEDSIAPFLVGTPRAADTGVVFSFVGSTCVRVQFTHTNGSTVDINNTPAGAAATTKTLWS